ncbi:MAG: uncharacterized protein A8A55_2048 [Amphiamblys sp. WSBS2006]|nr:MAG: uncharacterized protein A8A55_2048 [Amphiamblys sp. WSBS2006]
MPRHLISDVHEWISEIPTVPMRSPAKPQPGERAWRIQRGKKTLLSLTAAWRKKGGAGTRKEGAQAPMENLHPCARFFVYVFSVGDHAGDTGFFRLLAVRHLLPCGQFGWGGTAARAERRRPKVGSVWGETTL